MSGDTACSFAGALCLILLLGAGIASTFATPVPPVDPETFIQLNHAQSKFELSWPYAGGWITYSVAGGDDAARVEIDQDQSYVRGGLQFAYVQLAEVPDFASPADSDGDNVYHFTVEATDAHGTASQAMAIRVVESGGS